MKRDASVPALMSVYSGTPKEPGSGSNKKAVDRTFVDGIMKEAETKNLVTQ